MPNSLLLHSYNLGILFLLFFIVGMIKPKWALFFIQYPSRWIVIAISTVFFMIFMTMHGEGVKQAQMVAKHKKKPAAVSTAPVPKPDTVPVPVPKEVPKKEDKKK